MPDEKTWKDALLRSSLPLEQHVADLLTKSGYIVEGPFSYLRKSEHGLLKEFSVDISAYDEAYSDDGELAVETSLLVECKYATSGVQWVFSRLRARPGYRREPSTLADEAFTAQQRELIRHEDSFDLVPVCGRGITIRGKEGDTETIQRGANQLRFAAVGGMGLKIEQALRYSSEGELYATALTPILVTTADLRVLRHDMVLDDYHQAVTLDDVSDAVQVLRLHQEPGPELNQYCRDAHQILTSHVVGLVPKRIIDRAFAKFTHSATSVLVVSLPALPGVVETLARDSEARVGKHT